MSYDPIEAVQNWNEMRMAVHKVCVSLAKLSLCGDLYLRAGKLTDTSPTGTISRLVLTDLERPDVHFPLLLPLP